MNYSIPYLIGGIRYLLDHLLYHFCHSDRITYFEITYHVINYLFSIKRPLKMYNAYGYKLCFMFFEKKKKDGKICLRSITFNFNKSFTKINFFETINNENL